MLKHILVPLDASPAAESVVDRLLPLLARAGTDVVLLHVAEPPLAASIEPDRADDARAEAQGYVRDLAKKLSEKGVRCRGIVKPAPAAEAIVAEAAARPNGMIAMATHGRKGLARLAYGSIAESVLRVSPVPVLLVRTAGEPAKPEPLLIRRIIVPLDGSTHALGIAPHVTELVTAFHAQVTLVHVLPPKPAMGETVAHAERVIETAKALFADAGVTCDSLISTGDPAEEILEAAARKKADLIACSTHGRTGILRAVMGSIAEKVLRSGDLPMLVVRSA